MGKAAGGLLCTRVCFPSHLTHAQLGGLKGWQAKTVKKTVKETGIFTAVTIMEQFVLLQRSIWGTAAAHGQVDINFFCICSVLVSLLGSLGMGRSYFVLADSQLG